MGGQTFQEDRLGPHIVQIRSEVPQIGVVADLDFLPRGLHAFTGESGTGKTLILEAIKLVCGHDVKRWKTLQNYSVYATLYYPDAADRLAGMGIEVNDTFVVSVHKTGRRVYRINGIPVSRGQIAGVLLSFAVFASSDEKFRLGKSAYRLAFLDSGVDSEVLAELRKVYSEILSMERTISTLQDRIAQLESEILSEDLWKEAQELWEWIHRYDSLKEKLDEYEKIQQKLEILREILHLLADDGLLLKDLRRLDKLVMEAELDSGILEQFWDWLWSVRTGLEEKLEGIDIPDELPEIVWRIERLARKAGVYPDELSEFLVQEKSNRTELEQLKEGIESRSRELRNLKARFWELAHILRAERRKVAEELSHRINQYLSFLFSSNITFKPEVLPVNTIDFRLGSDVYFYILRSGQKVKPEEVFSSGELSRFVLALYLASGVVAPVLVFDEIDAGVSGDTAKKVAELLRQMGQKGQVIVATHSHFVAAAADVQFSWRDGYWVRLSNDQRVEEIARLIGSSPKAARELIQYFKGKG